MTVAGWLSNIINWLSLPVLAAVLGILVWQKLYREYFFFFFYITITVASGLVRFLVLHYGPSGYFYTYWISDLVISIFNILAVYELFVKRIFPKFYKVGLYRYLFPTLVIASIFLAWFAAIERRNLQILAFEDRVIDVVVVTVLMFFGLLMLAMGRRWARYDFGIAFGFAINAAAFLMASTVWMRWTTGFYRELSFMIPVIAYDVGSLIWLCCFWSGERRAQGIQSQSVTPELLGEARAWQSMLKNWISSKKI